MPTITSGNRLYLYQLLSHELGVGKQTALARVEEVLTTDDIAPEDLGFDDVRSLCEALPEFVKVTAFKKGYVYATILTCNEYDRALEKYLDGASGKDTAGGKPWKRRKGAKSLRPIKPRHAEKTATSQPLAPKTAPDDSAEPKQPVGPKPTDEFEPATEIEAELEPVPTQEHKLGPELEPVPTQEHKPVEKPEAEPALGSSEPSISLTITYVPEQEEGTAEPRPSDADVPVPAQPRNAHLSPAPASPRVEFPQDFHAEVRCPDEQLSILYQILPPAVDPLTTLEEDFRVARSTLTFEGTRSEVTFPLRFLRADGSTPVTVTLRRSVRAQGGKPWSLASVDGVTPEEVGLEGLAPRPSGAWAAFLPHHRLPVDAVDPERALAQTVSLGPWDKVLQDLASLAAPEDWGEDRHILRAYLIMTFARIQAQGLLLVAPDGSRAEFDTGLLTTSGAPLYARLAPLGGDIPWKLEAFATEGSAQPARYATSLAQVTFDPSLSSPSFAASPLMERNPRMATCAYDPIADDVRLLVPADDGRALALALAPSGYEVSATLELADAYACARVVSAGQPSWLAEGIA